MRIPEPLDSLSRARDNVVYDERSPAHVSSIIALLAAAGLSGQTSAGSLSVTGDIAAPLTLTASDLAQMPRETVQAGGAVGGSYEGVLLRDILARAGAPIGQNLRGKALATYILAKAADGYQVVFTPAEVDPQFAGQKILVADKRDGKPLRADQGPLRLVCPGDKEGARSVRMLESLEVVRLRK